MLPSGGRRLAHLDEDALAWARQRSIDHGLEVATRNERKAATSPGVVEGEAVLRDVGNAVLELDKYVGAVIEAESITGAQVLIDPHSHDWVEDTGR